MNEEYSLLISKSVADYLSKLSPKVFQEISESIFLLQRDPFPNNSKALTFCLGGYRFKQDDFIVLYTVEKKAVKVFRVTISSSS